MNTIPNKTLEQKTTPYIVKDIINLVQLAQEHAKYPLTAVKHKTSDGQKLKKVEYYGIENVNSGDVITFLYEEYPGKQRQCVLVINMTKESLCCYDIDCLEERLFDKKSVSCLFLVKQSESYFDVDKFYDEDYTIFRDGHGDIIENT